MKNNSFLQAYSNQWFLENELESIKLGFRHLNDWLNQSKPILVAGLPSAFYKMYVFAIQNEGQHTETNACLDYFLKNSPEDNFGESMGVLLDELHDELVSKRVAGILDRINDKKSLTHSSSPADFVCSVQDERLIPLYQNQSQRLNIDFVVKKLPFPLEVLDPRIVIVPPGKTNELHKHAHETVFIFLKGIGHVNVDQIQIPAKPGDFVFIPRWSTHQSVNEGADDLVFLAVADFGLTGTAFVGNYLKTARLKEM
jgi:hypothetical protein